MENRKLTRSYGNTVKKTFFATWALSVVLSCNKGDVSQKDLRNFTQVNLVANSTEYSPKTVDPTLINAFGIAWSPGGTAWVNSVGGHLSELYTAEGDTIKRVLIPSPTDNTTGLPCGIVFNPGPGFTLTNPAGQAAFLFTGFDGVLAGWNGASGRQAQRVKAPTGASFTGLAIANKGGVNFIYGANFGLKRIDVWDTAFHLVNSSFPFKDPELPADYSPYNIQAVGNWLFVMYAKLGSDGHGVAGAGNGFVSVFNTDGSFVRRFASRGTLNIPWGVTMATSSFLDSKDLTDNNEGHPGTSNGHKNDQDSVILVGNFGDGHINAYTLDGRFQGQLQAHNRPIVIEGLWALSFPPASAHIDAARLYFTAGPDHESDGVFGYLIKQ
jgi:uncharacterized protein (TIGR03118 family)